MASLRRLSINGSSIYSIRATIRPSSTCRSANHHYWASRSGIPYGGNELYNKDTYYTRWIAKRGSRYSRACGSWTPWYRGRAKRYSEDHDAAKRGPEVEKDSEKLYRQSWHPFEGEHFYKLLKQDPKAAYNYMHEEISKDPSQWLFRTGKDGGAWDAVNWWNRRKRVFERRKSWLEKALAEELEPEKDKADPLATQGVNNEEYRIDPITMKKVPITVLSSVEFKQGSLYPQYQPSPTEMGHDIPIKKYDAVTTPQAKSSQVFDTAGSEKNNDDTKVASKGWLANEGFTTGAAEEPTSIPNSLDAEPLRVKEKAKLEPSLDRLARAKSTEKQSVPYPPKEVTTDDVDLLRASDIRAASGRIKLTAKPTQGEIRERSKALEKDWNSLEISWAEDLSQAQNEIIKNRQINSSATTNQADDGNNNGLAMFKEVKQLHDVLQHKVAETAALMEKARVTALQDVLSQETDLVKQSFDKFEERSRKHVSSEEFGNADQQSIHNKPTQERIEAQKKKLERLERDAKLVKEVREIYEEQYGKITSDHKQESSSRAVNNTIESNPPEHGKPKSRPAPSIPAAGKQIVHLKFKDTGSFDNTQNGVTVRDLLYKGIDSFAFSNRTKKHLKFALRGIVELDAIIPGSAEDILNASKAAASSKTQPNTTFGVPDDHPVQSKISKASSKAADAQSILKQEKKIKSESLDHKASQNSENVTSHKPQDQTIAQKQDAENSQHKKTEDKTYVYKILALDQATNEIVVATANSSFRHKTSLPKSSASILVHLDQPARYFSHIEKLDSENYQVVSGSRSMLVFRKEVQTGGIIPDKMTSDSPQPKSRRPMAPLRQEPVFSGHLKPKERLLRSYQLAHRRARASNQENPERSPIPAQVQKNSVQQETQGEQRAKPKRVFDWIGRFTVAAMVLTLCYTIGHVRTVREFRDYTEATARRREEEAYREAEAEVLRNKRNWF